MTREKNVEYFIIDIDTNTTLATTYYKEVAEQIVKALSESHNCEARKSWGEW